MSNEGELPSNPDLADHVAQVKPFVVPPDGRILFFARDRAEFGFLSHFHLSPFALDGETWPTVEHFYQAQKSFDPRYRREIRACVTPGQAKRCAEADTGARRTTKSWFVRTGQAPRPDWMSVKRDIMRRADAAKFNQHPELAARLLACGDAEIIEDARHDAFWGIGRDGAGGNWAGLILMEVRASLRTTACHESRQS